MRKGVVIGALLAVAAASGRAQETTRVTLAYEPQSMAPARAATVVETRITTGRPYSAEATTEFVQVLGDGNKIVRKATVRIYRDGEGRTRREELAPDGTVRLISLYDPVAHVTYVLDPATHMARKSAVRVVMSAMRALTDEEKRKAETMAHTELEAGGRVAGRVSLVAPAEVPAHAVSEEMRKRHVETVVAAGAGRRVLQPAVRGSDVKNEESLGQKMIDCSTCRRQARHDGAPTGIDWQSTAHHSAVRAMVRPGPRDPRHDEAQRSAHRRNHLLAVEHHPRRARRQPLRRACGLHDPGVELPAHAWCSVTHPSSGGRRPPGRQFFELSVPSGFSRKAVAVVKIYLPPHAAFRLKAEATLSLRASAEGTLSLRASAEGTLSLRASAEGTLSLRASAEATLSQRLSGS